MIISLIGFMAAGKTTLGRELASSLKAPFIDMDAYIEEKEGKTIPEIFEASGESHFRTIELNYLEEILEEHISEKPETLEEEYKKCTLVISTGGGIVTTKECRDLLTRFTYCVYLKVDMETLFERLEKESENRPMLKTEPANEKIAIRSTIERLYHERAPLYEEIAQKII